MYVLDQKICDVLSSHPAAEEVFESLGVDYWFGWNRPLRSACEAAHVDSGEVAARLAEGPTEAEPALVPDSLKALLLESGQQAGSELLPGIERTECSARLLPEGGQPIVRLLDRLRRLIGAHLRLANSLLATSEAIDANLPDAFVDQGVLRRLRLDHLELLRLSKELGAACGALPPSPQAERCSAEVKQVVRAIHRHVKSSYNFILPRLLTAVKRRPSAVEPW
jgi:hypothetical protein